ncbi:hypothetical protein F5984_17525 [Rudanella paleaurantiibacter]|uniref:Uncharacterized protein n=1 Tax=Rudanella paleaurantiibacter TaxID=2614655 RepID=A0A7J5TW10_9BACT|nr:hypothetical protein [Rudanella paleaurantiibacter]KAB7728640.1 hypothetical protein F5984_17525 [Rudanella paleaurantiibacter]
MNPEKDIHAKTTDLLDQTMDLLEGNVAEMTPQNGKGIIDQWIEQLRHSENTTGLAGSLEQLKNGLEGTGPDPAELSQLLQTMSEQARQLGVTLGPEGDLSVRIEGLAAALRTAAGQFGQA